VYDHYEPLEIRCPSCDTPFAGWVGDFGPCRFFLYRQDACQPVDQLVDADARTPEADWPNFQLTRAFLITATAQQHMASATGVCDESGKWVQMFLHHASWSGCPVPTRRALSPPTCARVGQERSYRLIMSLCVIDYLVGMSVEESWRRIVTWLDAHAPQTGAGIQPPAGEVELSAAEAAFPRPWPDDLRRWYGLHNGASSRQLFTGALPGYAQLLSLQQVAEASRGYEEIFDEVGDEYEDVFDDPATLDQAPAGEMAGRFLRSWVPIAEDGTACTMFVDCRSGERSGCVTLFEREDADGGGQAWASVEAMLSDIADALERGRTCGGWRPRVNDGVLEWEPAED
jgi:cell wall assembly regulator SMI1